MTVRIVIADTGPVNYLILIGHIGLLPVLFKKVLLPTPRRGRVERSERPSPVRSWIANPPAWLEIHEPPPLYAYDQVLEGIDDGERAAIALASSLHAELLLIADRAGVIAAQR